SVPDACCSSELNSGSIASNYSRDSAKVKSAPGKPSPASLRSAASPAMQERGYEAHDLKAPLPHRVAPRERGEQAPTGPRGARPEDRLRAWWVRVTRTCYSAAAAARVARLRSFGSSSRLRRRIDCGVTS